ncbi:MAG: hypothetical protein KFF73_00455 [Cyclobacteriaceae bacterium]|nr:hypothetical protein [Cyclobacteriaceae bacterium]
MFRKSYLFLFIALILTGLLILYRYLGGFNEPEITFLDIHEYRIAGYHYEGRITGKDWEELFYRTARIAGKDSVAGDLTIVWYNEPGEEKGYAKAFIGIKYLDDPELPAGMETRIFRMNGVIRATMDAHVTVMPNPRKIARKIKTYALEQDYELQEILIETYPEESVIYAEIPVRN